MSNYKRFNSQGFTIVELLIVIVVIAILAAISIVSYTGIQNRARASAAATIANSIDKKLETWAAVIGNYPTYCQFATNTTDASGTATGLGSAGCTAGSSAGPLEAKLDNVNSIAATTASVTATNGTSVVYLSNISSTGTRVNYWNYSAATPALTTNATTPASLNAGSPV